MESEANKKLRTGSPGAASTSACSDAPSRFPTPSKGSSSSKDEMTCLLCNENRGAMHPCGVGLWPWSAYVENVCMPCETTAEELFPEEKLASLAESVKGDSANTEKQKLFCAGRDNVISSLQKKQRRIDWTVEPWKPDQPPADAARDGAVAPVEVDMSPGVSYLMVPLLAYKSYFPNTDGHKHARRVIDRRVVKLVPASELAGFTDNFEKFQEPVKPEQKRAVECLGSPAKPKKAPRASVGGAPGPVRRLDFVHMAINREETLYAQFRGAKCVADLPKAVDLSECMGKLESKDCGLEDVALTGEDDKLKDTLTNSLHRIKIVSRLCNMYRDLAKGDGLTESKSPTERFKEISEDESAPAAVKECIEIPACMCNDLEGFEGERALRKGDIEKAFAILRDCPGVPCVCPKCKRSVSRRARRVLMVSFIVITLHGRFSAADGRTSRQQRPRRAETTTTMTTQKPTPTPVATTAMSTDLSYIVIYLPEPPRFEAASARIDTTSASLPTQLLQPTLALPP